LTIVAALDNVLRNTWNSKTWLSWHLSPPCEIDRFEAWSILAKTGI